MKKALLATAALLSIYWMLPARAAYDGGNLDISTVNSVVVTGQSSLLRFSASASQPYRASLKGRRSGWFSFWQPNAGRDCASGSTMTVKGKTLYIDVTSTSWFDPSDCVVEVTAALPENVAVSVDQNATESHLTGHFSSVEIASRAGDVSLDGHAGIVAIKGDAVRARLGFDKVDHDEKISVHADALDLDLAFAPATAISYTVAAAVSSVDSALDNTPGAKPDIAISGQFVHARIR